MDTDIKINITDLQLRNLAAHVPLEKCVDLGLNLGLTRTDLSAIDHGIDDRDPDDDDDNSIPNVVPSERTFRVLDRWRGNLDPFLIRWRNKVDGRQTERVKLEDALRKSGLEVFIPCIDAHVTRKESESDDINPTVNLSLPNSATDADRKQEIDILAKLSGASDHVTNEYHKHLYRLVSHPTESDHNWRRICRVRSAFEPDCRVNNIELLPLCFTVDVVSLHALNNLSRSIESGSLASSLCDALDFDQDGARCGFNKDLCFKLDLDKTTFNEAVRFFKDLDPLVLPRDYPNPTLSADYGATDQSREVEGFGPWMSDSDKPEDELPDSARRQKGVGLVWRNVSQHNFGF